MDEPKGEDHPMTATQMTDVLVVGAGPTGLTLATSLARRGIACRIIDQEPTYHVGSRARAMNPPTLEIFEDLRVLEQLSAHAEPFLFTRLYDQNNRMVREIDLRSNIATFSNPGRHLPLKISQQQTEAVLRDYLASYGVQVELNCRLVGFSQDERGIVADIERTGKSEQIQASFLVGCDGGHSTVRTCAGIAFQGETGEDEYGLVGNASVSNFVPGFHIWADPARPSGFLLMLDSIRDDTWFFTASLLPQEYDPSMPMLEMLQRLFDKQVGMPGVRFSNPLWLSSYRPQNLRLAERYRNGRVLLVGDAAHIGMIHGMEAGIADAYNLGWKLADVLSGAPDTLLDTYQAERLPIAQQELAAGGFAAGARAIINGLLNKE
jgi:2-polyprenyl-6-methoxyphenol hydroxylase-like FAD-dependent oxidoreductase